MGASESVCHKHHSHSSEEAARECNTRYELEIERKQKEQRQRFLQEASEKEREYRKRIVRHLEVKENVLGSLMKLNLDIAEPEHSEFARKIIFDDGIVDAAVVCVAKEESVTLALWTKDSEATLVLSRCIE